MVNNFYIVNRKRILKSKVALRGETLTKLAQVLGIDYSTLWKKLNGNTKFSIAEMEFIRSRYNLTDAECVKIFAGESKQNLDKEVK